MQRGTTIMVAMVAALVATVLGVAALQADQAPPVSKLQNELRAAETAFAKTMADRDHAAFATFLADETIFFGRNGEIRGKKAVADAWASFFEGKEAPFSWKPETVSVLDSGTLGLSSGPVFGTDGKQFSSFNSIWRRNADGKWQIIFDRGCPYCGGK